MNRENSNTRLARALEQVQLEFNESRFSSQDPVSYFEQRGNCVDSGRGEAEFQSSLQSYFEKVDPGSLLDVGAGDGSFSRKLDQLKFELTLVEPGRWQSRELMKYFDPSRIQSESFLNLSFQNTFDYVLCLRCLEVISIQNCELRLLDCLKKLIGLARKKLVIVFPPAEILGKSGEQILFSRAFYNPYYEILSLVTEDVEVSQFYIPFQGDRLYRSKEDVRAAFEKLDLSERVMREVYTDYSSTLKKVPSGFLQRARYQYELIQIDLTNQKA